MGLNFKRKAVFMLILAGLAGPGMAGAATCSDAAGLCGQARIEGLLDARAIGLGAEEHFRVEIGTDGILWADLDMDQSGNTVADYGLEYFYEGQSENAAGPEADRFGGTGWLLPDAFSFGKIINDVSLSFIRLDLTTLAGALWGADAVSGPQVTDFKLEFGFLGLTRDADEPEYYDIDPTRQILLGATGFDLLEVTVQDGADIRRLEMVTSPAAVPLPASGMMLGLALIGLIGRRRKGVAA